MNAGPLVFHCYGLEFPPNTSRSDESPTPSGRLVRAHRQGPRTKHDNPPTMVPPNPSSQMHQGTDALSFRALPSFARPPTTSPFLRSSSPSSYPRPRSSPIPTERATQHFVPLPSSRKTGALPRTLSSPATCNSSGRSGGRGGSRDRSRRTQRSAGRFTT